ncbi:MAG: winged helix-turn-helix transcriptional regulator [Candidatus Aenigmarchaeota archaeon]|nr:winged helix-turn-helix transcriptional regulator [Candidatus Aenigmarchaeota archaeon]
MLITEKDLKRILWLYLGGTRGGVVRLKILLILKERPSNMNQLATKLGMDYTTIMHHMRVLVKSNLVVLEKKKYGSLYFLSPLLGKNGAVLEEMEAHIGKGL